MIPGVEHLPIELELLRLSNIRLLKDLQIEVVGAWPNQDVSAGISNSSGNAASREQAKSIDVVKTIDGLFALWQIAVADPIRPSSAGRSANSNSREAH